MENYLIIKQIHIITAVISICGFCLRAWWAFKHNPLALHKLSKIIPHINDTILLAAAIYLSVQSGLYPFYQGWLGAKVVLLLGYIVAGMFALKRGKTKRIKTISFSIALLCVISIFGLAVYRPF